MRNLAFPGAQLNAEERKQLARLKAKLMRVTTARLGPIPGFQWDLNVTVLTTNGRASGRPIGTGTAKVSWGPQQGLVAKGTFAISARSGQIVGTMLATVTRSGGAVVYSGTAKVTGGTGAYRGFTPIPGAPLKVRMAGGRLTLVGRVTSARVDGALTLTPLNPSTGL